MKNKIISLILIYCILSQILLTYTGCTSFFSDNGVNLSEYKNSKNKIMIKLKDKTDLIVSPNDLFLVDKPSDFIYGIGDQFQYSDKNVKAFKGVLYKEKIDSSKVLVNNSIVYHLYWTKDKSRFNFKDGYVNFVTPDSGSGFWIALDSSRAEFRKFYESEIEEIKVEKINWFITVPAFLLIGISILGFIFIYSLKKGF